MDDQIAVSVKNLSKDFKLAKETVNSLKEKAIHFRKPQYNTLHALKNINFDVNKGEFFGVIGRNGSGKSTLLKTLGGIYQPSRGTLKINGTLTPFIELGIGFNPELTGRENVFLNGAILGLTRKEIKAKYNEIVAFAELEKFMDQKLKNYSSGMQVRLAFSIAIRAHNDILLIDEVLAVGDMVFQEKCFDEFKRIEASDKTVIFVSHDLGAVGQFCERAMILKDGNMVNIGPAKDMAIEYSAMIADEQFDDQEPRKLYFDELGTGDIHITKAELLSEGAIKKHLRESQPFVIRTHFEVKNPDPGGYVFGVSVLDHNDISLFAPNTGESKFELKNLPNKGFIDAEFKSNPLSPGRFAINAAFFNAKQSVTHNYSRGLLKFKILGDGRHGILNIEPEWKLSDGKAGK